MEVRTWVAKEQYDGWQINEGVLIIASGINSGRDMGEKDAKLIAAAPELLKACLEFMELFSDSDMRPEDECHDLASTMQKAILKATE